MVPSNLRIEILAIRSPLCALGSKGLISLLNIKLIGTAVISFNYLLFNYLLFNYHLF